jgi:hypothetical protein
MTDLNWDEKIDKNTGEVVKFDEESYIKNWWDSLLPRQRADVWRTINWEDPIQAWKRE